MIIKCGHCKEGIEVDVGQHAGKPLTCPHCGKMFSFSAPVAPPPPLPLPDERERELEAELAEPLPTRQRRRGNDENPYAEEMKQWAKEREDGVPPEPWYYPAVEVMIYIGAVLGVLAVIISTIARAAHASHMRAAFGSAVHELSGVGSSLDLIGGLFLVCCFTATGLLLLDVARNIRLTRYNTESKGESRE